MSTIFQWLLLIRSRYTSVGASDSALMLTLCALQMLVLLLLLLLLSIQCFGIVVVVSAPGRSFALLKDPSPAILKGFTEGGLA